MASLLVVDDDELVLDMLCETLDTNEHTITRANNTVNALRAYQEIKPDLVITDIVMPGDSGISLIKMLKAQFPQVRIIAISGGGRNTSDNYLKGAELNGADAIFTKPVDHASLVKRIRDLTGPE